MAEGAVTLDDAKSIKVPLWAYDNAKLVTKELARRGTRSVTENTGAQTKCPLCSARLAVRRLGELQIHHCGACGYTLPNMDSTASITAGIVIGLALALLAESLMG